MLDVADESECAEGSRKDLLNLQLDLYYLNDLGFKAFHTNKQPRIANQLA